MDEEIDLFILGDRGFKLSRLKSDKLTIEENKVYVNGRCIYNMFKYPERNPIFNMKVELIEETKNENTWKMS